MNPRWLLRASRWARHPPSARRVAMVAGVVVFCLILYAIEQLFGWPDWLTPSSIHL